MEILRFMKRADISRNRIVIPKFIIDKVGRDFYLEYDPKTGIMKLTPIKTQKKGK